MRSRRCSGRMALSSILTVALTSRWRYYVRLSMMILRTPSILRPCRAEDIAKVEDPQTSAPLPAERSKLSRSWLGIAAAILVVFTGAALYWRFHSRFALSSSDTLVLADMNNQTGDA